MSTRELRRRRKRRLLSELRSLARAVIERRPLEKIPPRYRGLVAFIEDAVAEVRLSFPRKGEGWFERAVLRLLTVKQLGDDVWQVEGFEELGDEYPNYRVRFDAARGKYTCECMFRRYGSRRRREVCTHVAAVILYRRLRSRLTRFAADELLALD